MTQQAAVDSVGLFEAAVEHTKKYIAGIQPGQLPLPTPCTEWSVSALTDHIVGGVGFHAANVRGVPQEPPEIGIDLSDTYELELAKLRQALSEPGALDKTITLGTRQMPARDYLMTAFMDTLIHGWDLAKATGQDTTLPPDLVEACYAAYKDRVQGMRDRGIVGPEVKVPDDAPLQTKLLGIMGRQA